MRQAPCLIGNKEMIAQVPRAGERVKIYEWTKQNHPT